MAERRLDDARDPADPSAAAAGAGRTAPSTSVPRSGRRPA
ncbi:hypothetical protein SERN_1204 [Serinibacter arcticus]|uniref:Uncharacterized protein n=1 Tax=Serinibacter arcticus TaxID=1655435 RepID=A0A4Z1E1G1_9MICO|nr:hypothetical protein SERN_1204 [Serinibacter arcticus]